MNTGKRMAANVIILIFATLLSLGLGLYFGFSLGAGTVATVSLNTQVGHASTSVEILRLLRTGKNREAMDRIEDRLDAEVVSLLPEYREGLWIDESSLAGVSKALQLVKRYRKEYPWTNASSLRHKEVERALSLED